MKPNFSGTWIFNRKRSKLQIPAPDASVFIVDHHEPAFRLSRTHTSGGRSDTFSIDLTTDGKEVVVEGEGIRLRGRSYWEGETLVFDSTIARGELEGRNIVRYSLEGSPAYLVAEERFRSGALNYDNVWVLEKRGR